MQLPKPPIRVRLTWTTPTRKDLESRYIRTQEQMELKSSGNDFTTCIWWHTDPTIRRNIANSPLTTLPQNLHGTMSGISEKDYARVTPVRADCRQCTGSRRGGRTWHKDNESFFEPTPYWAIYSCQEERRLACPTSAGVVRRPLSFSIPWLST